MAPIEQKDGAAAAVGRCRDIGARRARGAAETYLGGLPATASATLWRELEAEAGSRRDVVLPIVAVFPA